MFKREIGRSEDHVGRKEFGEFGERNDYNDGEPFILTKENAK